MRNFLQKRQKIEIVRSQNRRQTFWERLFSVPAFAEGEKTRAPFRWIFALIICISSTKLLVILGRKPSQIRGAKSLVYECERFFSALQANHTLCSALLLLCVGLFGTGALLFGAVTFFDKTITIFFSFSS